MDKDSPKPTGQDAQAKQQKAASQKPRPKSSKPQSDFWQQNFGESLGPWLDLIQTDLRRACGLLTRLPLPAAATAPTTSDTPPRFYWAFPLVGVIVAGIAVAPLLLLGILPIPNLLLAVGVLIVAALLTGALHEDGLADLADSLGGQSPEDRLTIMHDSRIGTFGVLALVLVVVIHVGALTVMIDREMLGGWVAAAALSRAMMVLMAWMHPPIKSDNSDEGMAYNMGQPSSPVMFVALGLGFGLAWVFSSGLAAFLAVLLGLVAGFVLGVFVRAHLGGVTGDALGATQQIISALVMIVMAAV